MKTTVSAGSPAEYSAIWRFFDIVNGFLIDAVAHRDQLWGAQAFQMPGTFAAQIQM